MGNPSELDPYAPCHCGSGKKYKFCCLKNDRKEAKPEAPTPKDPSAPGGARATGGPDPRASLPKPGTNWKPPTPRTPGRNG